MNKTIDEKIKFVDDILSKTENMRTYRLFKDIISYIVYLRRENKQLIEANVDMQDKMKDLLEGGEENVI